MNNTPVYIMEADNTTKQLNRGSADYWIIYIHAGEAEFIADTNMCYATADQAVLVTMINQDVQITPSTDFKASMVWVNDSSSAELMRSYFLLMNLNDDVFNVVWAGKQAKNIELVYRNMRSIEGTDEITRRYLLEELMIRLYRARPKIQIGVYTNRTELVGNICHRLEKEFYKDFFLAEIAKEYGVSISYLAHLFKDTTGVPIMRYLLNCRINEAKKYLTQTVMPIKEIAEKCGFNDSSNFGRTFKKETGCSPRQYRQHYSSAKTKDSGI